MSQPDGRSVAAAASGGPGPRTDGELPAFLRRLDLPGIIDMHVHFMPERLLHKVWAYFDTVPPTLGIRWPIHYRHDERTRIDTLHQLGVRAHTALVYPHKPGIAAGLNDWCRAFAANVPNCVPSGTFYAEPEAADYVRLALDSGVRVFKAHLQVGGYDPTDPLLDPVWGMLADAGTPVVCHCGSGPIPGAFTGPGPIATVLARHPRLMLVVAHCGAPEYADFLSLVERHPNVHLDTTMVFTDFTARYAPYPAALLPRLRDVGHRVVFGSDYPNIPYPYAHQVDVLARLDFGVEWLRAVLHDNGARLIGR